MSYRHFGQMLCLFIAVSLLLTACGEKTNTETVTTLNERLEETKALFDSDDYPGAAKAFGTLLDDFRQSEPDINYKTAMSLREQVLLPLYEWLGVTEDTWRGGVDDTSRIVGSPMWAQAIIQGSYQKDADNSTKAHYVVAGTEDLLERVYRYCLYRYYRHAMDEGADICALGELPYTHDQAWGEFSKALIEKYPVELSDDFAWQGGSKLLIQDGEKTRTEWRDWVLEDLSPMDLAVSVDEVGYILEIAEEWSPMNFEWVNSTTGDVVKEYYQSNVMITLKDLSTGDARVLLTSSASPSFSSAMDFNSSAGNVGRHSYSDAKVDLREKVYPALKGIARVFPDE